MSILPQPVTIQAYQPENQAASEQLMQQCWPDDPDTIAYYRIGEQSELTLCAWQEQQLVGISSLWNNRFHPQHCYIGIHVQPTYQQTGIEQQLYNRLIAETSLIDGRGLQTATWSHAQQPLNFLQAQGFQIIKNTYLGELSLSALEIAQLEPTHELTIASFKTYLSSNQPEALLNLINSCYQANHSYNPASQATLEAQSAFLTDLHPAASFVVYAADQLVGFNCIYHSTAAQTLEQGLIGVAPTYSAQQAAIIRALLQKTVHFAQHNGYQSLRYEIDSIDPWASEVLTFLPIITQPCWQTLCLGHNPE
ncbi:GNAT family N-acetyltransferase [Herpetosiphon llansteffanensis]|uniref:GNAT family N-acetyltransferase n=1 Tax=Herpetosiphon llansteffanensis TaxID=2094568 RepID=UPI000D7CDF69|nr:GNAT family N-acetyltransferase [Herpetosiphon llansteffanensis]